MRRTALNIHLTHWELLPYREFREWPYGDSGYGWLCFVVRVGRKVWPRKP